MSNSDLVLILIYAGTCYAMYRLYQEYLAQLEVTPSVVFVATAAPADVKPIEESK